MNVCPNCGSALTSTDKFCGECGASLAEENTGNDTVEAIDQGAENASESSPEEHDSSVGQSGTTPPSFEPIEVDGRPKNTAKKNSPSKKAIIAGALVLLVVVVGCLAAWLLSSGAPSYDKLCQMNDDLKQARQLGLSTQGKCAERLGNAILQTTDETVLAKLLANVSLEDRFANAILGKIQTPESIETVARTFKAELFASGSDISFPESLYNAVLDRLPDDATVERIVNARLAEFGGESDSSPGGRGKQFSGNSELASCLCRRILAMDDTTRTDALLERMGDSDVLRKLPFEMRLGLALRSKNEKIRHATGADSDILELGDLVAQWDPECLSRSVREIIARGREIQNAQEYVEVIKEFDPYFKSNDIDKWVEYAKSVTPVLEALDRLSAKSNTDSSDSFRRSSIVEKRDKAKKSVDEYKKVIDDVRAAVDANNVATIMAACEFVGVHFDASDPEDTGWRLGNKLKQRYQEAKSELEEAEREFAAFDRLESSQRERDRERKNNEMSKLKAQLETIRQHYETPEARDARKARMEREAREKAAREAREQAEQEAQEKAKQDMFEKVFDEAHEFLANSPFYSSRLPNQRNRALGKWGAGGSDAAVMRALRWLKMQQKSDGSWGDSSTFRTALTGMAILTYLAHNETPAPDTEFGPTVARAIRFLCDSLGSGEYFRDKDGNNYSHPIGVYALGEAYAMTKNPLVKSAVERAAQPLIRGQNANNGWEYGMRQTARTDNSYSGWCAQAVKAVHASGAQAPGLDECYEKAKHTFDSVYRGDGQFMYQSENGGNPNGHPGETPIATLCMQLLEQYNDPRVKAAMRFMGGCTYDFEHWENQPWGGGGANPSPVYYWYYLTQAKFQEGGATFGAWNKLFLPELQKRQQIVKGENGESGYQDLTGKYRDIGWWDSPSQEEAYRQNSGGLPCTWWRWGQETQGLTSLDCRIMDTTLCALQLMVYYRFLPSSQAK